MTRLRLALTTALLATFALTWPTTSSLAAETSILFATGEWTGAVHDVLTDGTYVAWRYGAGSPSTNCNTLNVAPLNAPDKVTSVTIAKATPVALSGGNLLWSRMMRDCNSGYGIYDPGIYGLNLATGQPFTVTTEETNGLSLVDHTIVWSTMGDHDTATAIRMKDITGGAETTIAEIPAGISVSSLRFHGERISWVESDLQGTYRRVMSMVFGEQPIELMKVPELYWFDVRDGWFLWQIGNMLQAQQLATGHTRAISDQASSAISTDGRYVLYWAAEPSFERGTLRAYDLTADSRFTVIPSIPSTETDSAWVESSAIEVGVIAWSNVHTQKALTEIRATKLANVVPSGPLSGPDTSDPYRTFYPQTGHYLAYAFRSFWEQNGGLPVFGYPLTEEFAESEYTVQYTERQRFEYHPGYAGTPYAVELGLLGTLDAQRNNLLDTPPFHALPSDTPGDANCTFFEETGHRLCSGFKSFWQSHGLDMSDPGISYRESLALLGYPISEEFVDSATGYVIQYFQRAIFEYHPENAGTPYTVLLRRLGADELQERGWTP